MLQESSGVWKEERAEGRKEGREGKTSKIRREGRIEGLGMKTWMVSRKITLRM